MRRLLQQTALLALVPQLLGCPSGAQQAGPSAAPVSQPPAAPPPVAGAPAPQPAAANAPVDVAIADLTPDPDRVIRIKGVISSVVGMRLVPPKVILKVTDNSGTATVLINEQVQLSEGTKMELVGSYKTIPSPMYSGPGEAPTEEVFVVERYLDLP
jgi:hypothetical protein